MQNADGVAVETVNTSAADTEQLVQITWELFNGQQYADALDVCARGVVSCGEGPRLKYFLLARGMSEYYLGRFAELSSTLEQLSVIELPDDYRCRYLMLHGRLLAHRREDLAFAVFAEAEAICGALGLEQDEAWAQLSAARLALVLSRPEATVETARRVTFPLYQPKARLLEAEALIAAGGDLGAETLVNGVLAGEFGLPEDVDLARAMYIQAYCLFLRDRLLDAGLLLGEARNKARGVAQQDFELLNAIEQLRTLLETRGG